MPYIVGVVGANIQVPATPIFPRRESAQQYIDRHQLVTAEPRLIHEDVR